MIEKLTQTNNITSQPNILPSKHNCIVDIKFLRKKKGPTPHTFFLQFYHENKRFHNDFITICH